MAPHMITGTTRLFAIIGDPITHVRTPMVFNDYFAAYDIDAVCLPIHIERDRLQAGWSGLNAIANLDGFIVTAPHKAGAKQLSDALTGDSPHVGMVNAVRRERDGSYTGTLLDGHGFVAGLRSQGHEPAGKRIYIAGAGGAGNALAFALAGSGAKAITIFNRTGSKAADLVARLKAVYPGCEVTHGTRNASGHDIACNATSLGLEPGDGLSFDLETVSPPTLVADVIMKPETTKLLVAAAARDCKTHQGRHMLDGQLLMMMEFFGLATRGAGRAGRTA
jgi:shikimate dehydrogenase